MVKVSIIVPIFNTEKYLKTCLNSLVNQTLKDIEIICVNDGSIDNSANIVKEYLAKDSRIKLLEQENKKQGSARNLGFTIATGEYIGYVDSDDWIDLDYFEKLYNSAKKYNSDIALATNVRIRNGKTKKRLNIKEEKFYTSNEEKIIACNQYKNSSPCNKIYKRDLLTRNNIRFPEGVFCEDKIFTLKAIIYANGVVSVPNINYYYFRNLHSTVKSSEYKTKMKIDEEKSRREMLDFIQENNIQIPDKMFWATKKVYKLFNLPILQIKESLYTQKYYLFSLLKIREKTVIPEEIITQKNYQNIIKNLREKFEKNKIKVIFLVRENQKWSYQGLYEKLKQDERFEPIVAISLLTLAHKGKDKTRQNLSENTEFFKKKGVNFVYAYRNKKYIDLREFNPDIVFYDQPWDLPQIHSPYYVSSFALTCYVPYGFGVLDFKEDYTKSFHKLLFRFFVENELNIQRFETYESGNSENCIALGQPKLDAYINGSSVPAIWKDESKLKIIYAPHHSFDKNGLNFATFQENGKFILELAKKYQNQTTWIFKPHPRFRYACWRRKIMTLKESENYYKEWKNIGKIHESGDYFEIFKTSDLMISDCCSFLAEYLPANKPYIRLVSDNMSVKFNSIGEKIINCCYEAKNNMDIEKYFRDIIINKNDNKKENRSKIIPLVIDFKETSSAKIYRNIVEELERGE